MIFFSVPACMCVCMHACAYDLNKTLLNSLPSCRSIFLRLIEAAAWIRNRSSSFKTSLFPLNQVFCYQFKIFSTYIKSMIPYYFLP